MDSPAEEMPTMRMLWKFLVELACGAVLAAVLVLGDKFLLASPVLVYLLMPSMALAAGCLGAVPATPRWRRKQLHHSGISIMLSLSC